MNKKTKQIAIVLGILLLGISVFGVQKLLAGGGKLVEELEIEYWSVCRGLPENAHWTGGNTDGLWKEIPQTETEPNVWGPSPIAEYLTGELDSAQYCTFECNEGHDWEDGACVAPVYFPEPGMACAEAPDITIGDFTIQACNLGADVVGTGEDSYGRHFQRGNNFGFWNGIAGQTDEAGNNSIVTSTEQVDATNYGPGNYYKSNVFITADETWENAVGEYSDWSIQNDNLRGGSDSDGPDTIPTETGAIDRQGPCPDGYHVPSQGEWNQLLIAWAVENGIALEDYEGYKYFGGNSAGVQKFIDDLLIPSAGYRYYDFSAPVDGQGGYGLYWSSSPVDSSSRTLGFDPSEGHVYADGSNSRAFAFSLRCFQNPPPAVEPVVGMDCDEAPDITIGEFTIQACNLGADVVGTGEDSYGRHFQRGNNFGFWNGIEGQTDEDGNEDISTSTEQVDTIDYGPGNYYKSNVFITADETWENAVAQNGDWSIRNDNLRGGSDSDGPDTIPTETGAIDRQGPCPDGYHVPSQGEWNQLLITWADENGIDLNDFEGYKFFGTNAAGVYKFMDDLLIPFAGRRDYDFSATVRGQGEYGSFWSSSPSDSNSRTLSFSSSRGGVDASYYYRRAIAFSLRCFQNPH